MEIEVLGPLSDRLPAEVLLEIFFLLRLEIVPLVSKRPYIAVSAAER